MDSTETPITINNFNIDEDKNDDLNDFFLELDEDCENIIITVNDNEKNKKEEEEKEEESFVIYDLCGNIHKVTRSELDLIEQLNFLVDKIIIPPYLYPPSDLITPDYIKKISEHLYRMFLYKKLYTEPKRKSYFVKSPSKLCICRKFDDFKSDLERCAF